ncbi:hypothetical protein FRC17_006294 [Serendipita sp. 399]|nr:hypothetical protein FRC17_006294 [Serendipita sp. 399]
MQFKLSDPSTGRNPFHIIVQLPTYVDPSLLNDVCAEKSASGVCIRDRDPGYMYYGGTSIEAQHYRVSVMGCTITVVNVGYTYYNGTYIVDQPTVRLADNATTWAVGSVLYGEKPPVSFITNAANALASSGGESSALAKVIEERLSRLLLALSHSAFEMSPILTLSSRQTLMVTVLPTYIVVAFFAFLVAFAAFVVVLTIMALTSSREALVIAGNTQSQSDDVVNAVEIAKQRLCEPAGLIYQVFEGKTGQEEGEDRWAKEGIEIFLEGQDPQRRWETMVDGRNVKVGLDEDGLFGFQ